MSGLRCEARCTNRGEVRAATEFAQDRCQLHRTARGVGCQRFAFHRGVQAQPVGVGGSVHRVGGRNECVEACDRGELCATEFRTALQVRGARLAWRTLGLCRLPGPSDDGRVEVTEVGGKRRAVAVAKRATTAEDVELHPVQTQLLADRPRLGSEVEAVPGVADERACLGDERSEGRVDGHEPTLVRRLRPFVGQTGAVSPTDLLGALASALSMLFIWPQVFRVYRNDTVEGLAPLGALQGMSGSILWSTYGLAQGDLPLFGSNLLVAVAVGLLAHQMTRHGVINRSTLFGVVASVLGVGFVATSVSTALVGALAFGIGALSILPQTIKVLRESDLHGVSVSSNALLFVTSTTWMCYGIAIGDALVTLPNVLVIPCSAIIVLRARGAQRASAVDTRHVEHVG